MAAVQEVVGKAMGEFLSPEALARYLGVPVGTLYAWRHKGTGPVGLKIGKHIRYRRAEVEKWLEAQADPRRSA